MVIVENRQISNIPTLHLVKQELQEEKLPLVLFVHGFTSAKEHNLHYGYLLAEEGFRVVLPDAQFHGERDGKYTGNELNFLFWDIVVNEIKELQVIKDELVSEGLADETRIGVAGTSMGGITTLGALTQYPWINAAVSLMGSPYYESFCRGQIDELKRHNIEIPFSNEELEQKYEELKTYDLTLQPEKIDRRPLLFWHGEKDEVVPFHYTYEFYKKILSQYRGEEDKIRFIVDPEADHKVSRVGLLETVKWFKKYL